MRSEADTAPRQAAAIGTGLFVGCTPLFGLHFPLCLLAGWLFGLNRLKIYIAANISNPFFSPLLLFAEVQIGALSRRGRFYSLSLDAFRELDPWLFTGDLLVGSLVLGTLLGIAGGLATYALVSRWELLPAEKSLVERASHSYLTSGILSWEFANGKLRYDPVYRDILRQGLLPPRGTLLDLGCGQGLLLALLRAARDPDANWPQNWPPPPRLDLHGFERRAALVRQAREALHGDAIIELTDLRDARFPTCEAATLLDVLHYLDREEQDQILERIGQAIVAGGTLLLREVDRQGGWRFLTVRVSERLRCLLRGQWGPRMHYRSRSDWASRLSSLGFDTSVEEMGRGTPFANVLIRARKRR